jgi:hypothetical protein
MGEKKRMGDWGKGGGERRGKEGKSRYLNLEL